MKLRSAEWVQQQKKAGKVQALFGPLLGDEAGGGRGWRARVSSHGDEARDVGLRDLQSHEKPGRFARESGHSMSTEDRCSVDR